MITVIKDVFGHGGDVSDIAIFCVRQRLPEHNLCTGDYSENEVELRAIETIEGVSRIMTYDHDCLYNLHVKKAHVYSWEEIENEIISLLNQRDKRLALVPEPASISPPSQPDPSD